jgi:hypothetical protein
MKVLRLEHFHDEKLLPAAERLRPHGNSPAEAVLQNKTLEPETCQGFSNLRQFIFGAMDCEPGAVRDGQCLLEQGTNVFGVFQKTVGVGISLSAMNLFSVKTPSVIADSSFVAGFLDEPISQLFKFIKFTGFHLEIGANSTPCVLGGHDFLLFFASEFWSLKSTDSPLRTSIPSIQDEVR